MPTRSGATRIRAVRSARRISLRAWKGLCGGVWRRERAGVQRNQRSTPGNRLSDSASAESAETFRLSPPSLRWSSAAPAVSRPAWEGTDRGSGRSPAAFERRDLGAYLCQIGSVLGIGRIGAA
jgi:hypothetical protein